MLAHEWPHEAIQEAGRDSSYMSRGAKRDHATTRLAREMGWLRDKRSFVTLPALHDGKPHVRLFGEDKSRVCDLVYYVSGLCVQCGIFTYRNFDECHPQHGEVDHIKNQPFERCDCPHNLRVLCHACHQKRHVRIKWTPKEVASDAS